MLRSWRVPAQHRGAWRPLLACAACLRATALDKERPKASVAAREDGLRELTPTDGPLAGGSGEPKLRMWHQTLLVGGVVQET